MRGTSRHMYHTFTVHVVFKRYLFYSSLKIIIPAVYTTGRLYIIVIVIGY
jgi:hypothetical protein